MAGVHIKNLTCVPIVDNFDEKFEEFMRNNTTNYNYSYEEEGEEEE
jgi:hypothetical protein